MIKIEKGEIETNNVPETSETNYPVTTNHTPDVNYSLRKPKNSHLAVSYEGVRSCAFERRLSIRTEEVKVKVSLEQAMKT